MNKGLYRRAFSHLKASPDTGKAVLSMAEKKSRPKKFILRRVLVAAAALALVLALAVGANAATGGRLLEQAKDIVIFLENGETGKISIVSGEDGRLRIDSRVLEAKVGEDGSGKCRIFYEDADGEPQFMELDPGEASSTAP